MPTSPTHRSGNRDDGQRTLTAASEVDGAVTVLTPHGQWDWRLFLDLYAGVHKHLAEYPPALIIDLHDLVDPTTASAPLWLTARRSGAAMRPPVQVALCLPPRTPLADRLHRLGAKRFLPVYDTVPQARTALASGAAVTDRLQQRLPPEPESARVARLMVADACHGWHLPHLRDRAKLVMSELVSNAIEHARTDMLVTVSRRGTGLYLAVRDGSPTLPQLRLPESAAVAGSPYVGGRGLHIVSGAVAAWGALPTHQGDGKVVWATLRVGAGSARSDRCSPRPAPPPPGSRR
jgi:anti-sigma regulatory factor (Ser/Thr protein kinase)